MKKLIASVALLLTGCVNVGNMLPIPAAPTEIRVVVNTSTHTPTPVTETTMAVTPIILSEPTPTVVPKHTKLATTHTSPPTKVPPPCVLPDINPVPIPAVPKDAIAKSTTSKDTEKILVDYIAVLKTQLASANVQLTTIKEASSKCRSK